MTVTIQQIHSLRARGVKSCQRSSADSSANKARRRSAGTVWTTPPEMVRFLMYVFYHLCRCCVCLALLSGNYTPSDGRIYMVQTLLEKNTLLIMFGHFVFVPASHSPGRLGNSFESSYRTSSRIAREQGAGLPIRQHHSKVSCRSRRASPRAPSSKHCPS